MEPYRYYCDLVNEIELLEYQLNLCINERHQWSFNGRLGKTVRMDQAAERMDKLAGQIERLSDQLGMKNKQRKHIEHKLSQFKSIEYKVAYGRVVKNQSLVEIADELGYSINYIKKISASVTEVLERAHF